MSTTGHIFSYQVTDKPGRWLRVIDVAGTIDTLLADLDAKFLGRLIAVRNDSIPDDIRTTCPPDLAAPPPVDQARASTKPYRHQWEKLAVHHYRCLRCRIERRNWIDPDDLAWFSTYTRPGGSPQRAKLTPPCTPAA